MKGTGNADSALATRRGAPGGREIEAGVPLSRVALCVRRWCRVCVVFGACVVFNIPPPSPPSSIPVQVHEDEEQEDEEQEDEEQEDEGQEEELEDAGARDQNPAGGDGGMTAKVGVVGGGKL